MKSMRIFAASALAGVSFLAVATPAFAQSQPNAPKEEAEEADTIVVTGSRIPRPEFEGTIPGAQVTSADIQSRAFTNAIEVLNDIPLVGGGANLNGNNGGQPSSLGAAFVDLLDLGTARTLTLVNGRRFVSGNAASLFVAGNESGGQVDVNVIPASLIDRVDVLTVGGAVAYGSDAVAGVVNYILRDDYTGGQVRAQISTTSRGDGLSYNLSGIYGMNIGGDRGNVVASFEYNKLGGIQGDARPFRSSNPSSITSFANGSRRNSGFTPAIVDITGANNGAFFRASDDGVANALFFDNVAAVNIAPGGAIFNILGTLPAGSTNQIGPVGNTFFAGNTQLIGGIPVGNGRATVGGTQPAGLPFTVFAPTALPTGVTAASVVTALAPSFVQSSVTPAQLSTIAVNLLQANRPTPRELFASNPTIPLDAFVGSFVTAFPDVANTDTRPVTVGGVTLPLNQVLPRVAVPIRFNDQGQIEQYNLATLTPTTPSTVGGAVNGQGFNPLFNTVLRVDQKRYIGNLNGHYDLTENLRFYTENTVAKLEASSLRNGGSGNTAASGTTENAALVVNVNNPYLTAAQRTTLANAGITGSFVLSRTNQDVAGENGFSSDSTTFRTVNGLTWDFDFLGRDLKWDSSVSYGRAKGGVSTQNIKDVEYALAVDTAVDGNGNIVCRSKLTGVPAIIPNTGVAGVAGSDTNIRGAAPNLIRAPGTDGIPTEQVFTPRVTQSLIDACQPLNPFGYNQMSAASKAYVLGEQRYDNTSSQLFLQTSVGGSIFDLPAGGLGVSAFGEFRKEKLDFTVDELSVFGRTRTAAIAQTSGEINAWEVGGEIRIPLLGGDFTAPLFQDFSANAGVRFVKQSGDAPTYRNLAGALVNPKSQGKVDTIWSLGANWKPIDDITLRANVTRSIRQPGVVELFLGGQPAFTTPTDPCSTAQIGLGSNPTRRRENCIADVIRLGIAGNAGDAATFLNGYRPNGTALSGTFSGNNGLKSERGKSWTAGAVFAPSFVPGLQVSADYINLDLENIVSIVGAAQALFFCYDSSTFPDTTAQFGSNACNFFSRGPESIGAERFQLQNGFRSGFLNLASTKVRAVNISGEYTLNFDDLFKTSDGGKLKLRSNAYHLIKYDESAAGDFTDTQKSAGSTVRPKWEVQASAEYTNGGFNARWTANWQSATKIFSGGSPITIETQDIIGVKSYALHDATIGYTIDEKLGFRLTMQNVFDKNFVESNLDGAAVGFVDSIGRRIFFTSTLKF